MIVFEIDYSASPTCLLLPQKINVLSNTRMPNTNEMMITRYAYVISLSLQLSKMATLMKLILCVFFVFNLVSAQVQFPLEAGEQSGRMVIVDQR